MDYKIALAIGLPSLVGVAAVASAFALGRAVSSAMDATGRQPEASGKIMLTMIIGCALIEAITIYALVFAFSLAGKLQ